MVSYELGYGWESYVKLKYIFNTLMKKTCSTDAERSRCHQNKQIEINKSVDTEIICERNYKQYIQKFYHLRLQQKKLFALKSTK